MIRRFAIVFLIAAGLMVGCDSKKEEPAAPAQPSGTPAVDQVTKDITKAVDTAKNAAQDLVASAEKRIQEALQYVKENKLDAADKILKELEAVRNSLPEAVQKQLTQARTALDAARKAAR